jgi:hypothetical protein
MKKPRSTKEIGRKRRTLGWTLLALGVIAAGALVTSRWRTVMFDAASWRVGCDRGLVFVHNFDKPVATGRVGAGFMVSPAPAEDPGIRLSIHTGGPPPHWNVGVASRVDAPLLGSVVTVVLLWPLPLFFLPAGALLLRSGIVVRKRAITGKCRKCGYDLAGLAAERLCPECGT